MLDLTDLTYFVTVAREGGVTRAAEKLFRVQSNVTTRVRKLEDQLGVSLFLREGRRMVLTADGHRLLPLAEDLLSRAASVEDMIRKSEPGGRFRLGSMESTAAVRLPAVLERLASRHPTMEVELVTGNPVVLAEKVASGEIEAAFAAGVPPDAPVDRVPAFAERVTIVSSGDTLKERSPLLVMEKGCPHRARLEIFYAQSDRQIGRMIEMGSYHAMFGCVLAGMGAALVPESVIDTFPNAARLCKHALPGEMSQLTTDLFWRQGMASANTRALIEVLG